MDLHEQPKLRALDFFPAEISNQKVVCVRDPLNLTDKVLFFPYPAFFIISLFDGQHSVVDIQAEFMRRFGEILFREKIQEITDFLEAHYLLDDERFREMEKELIVSFQRAPRREMALVGQGYDADPLRTQEAIDSYFTHRDGPRGPLPADMVSGTLTGVIAPHIDYRRGGPCYAWAHQAIRQCPPPDLFVILGTAHSATARPFILTQKDFVTPWGVVETDRSFVNEMIQSCPTDFLQDEFAHKSEHSIELQLIFLRAHWQSKLPFRIVPVLCGSFHEAILAEKSPLEIPEIRSFIDALRTVLGESQKRICLVASADLAHVGTRFGDPEPPGRAEQESLAREDRAMLEHVERIDGASFYQCILREKDRRRVCGLSPIYTLLEVIQAKRGVLLQYGQSPDEATGSAVSFASMAFFS